MRTTRIRPHRAASLLVLTLGVAACGGSDAGKEPSANSAAAKPLSGPELIAKVRGSTVSVVAQPPGETRPPKIGGTHSHGSGVIYDARQGLVLTSNHLVEDAGSIKVRVNEKTEVQGRAVARAQCDNLALLALNPKPAGLVDLPLADIKALREGERVTALGYLLPPDGRQRLLTATGDVSAIDVPGSIAPELPDLPSLILHQAPLKPASTGGPLVNARGQLVGLNTVLSADAGAPFNAISSRRLSELLGELQPGKGRRFKGWGSEHGECHAVMAKLHEAALVSHGGPDDSSGRSRPSGSGGGGHRSAKPHGG